MGVAIAVVVVVVIVGVEDDFGVVGLDFVGVVGCCWFVVHDGVLERAAYEFGVGVLVVLGVGVVALDCWELLISLLLFVLDCWEGVALLFTSLVLVEFVELVPPRERRL